MSEQRWIKLQNVQLWKKNYHSGDVGSMCESIRQFGYNDTLKFWHGTCMAGNTSTQALRALKAEGKWKPVGDGIRVAADGSWEVKWQDISHLPTEEEAIAFAIAHNNIGKLGQDDDVALTKLLDELASKDDKLVTGTGYSLDDLDEMLAQLAEPETAGDPETLQDSLDDRLQEFADKDIRRIVMFFSAGEYEALIPRVEAAIKGLSLENTTELFLELLRQYEHTASNPEIAEPEGLQQ